MVNTTRFFLSLSIAALALAGCSHNNSAPSDMDAQEGTIITQKFLASNSGTFIDPEQKGTFTINSDGSFKKGGAFQVGGDVGEVRYPTVCRYSISGVITKVYERSAAARDNYTDYATHLMKITVNKFELDRTSGENNTLANCEKYENQQNAQLPLLYSYYSEVISGNHIRLHNSSELAAAVAQPTPATTEASK